MMNYILALCVLFIGLFSCKNETAIEQPTVETTPSSLPVPTQDVQAEKVVLKTSSDENIPKPKKKKKLRKPVAKFEFSETEYDFGMKEEGDIIKHDFPFTNTGKIPMNITSAESTCGCTIPEWPKEPIAPGESGVISATFDTKGKLGSQKKVITIRANTYPKKTTVALVGFIGTMAKKKEKVEGKIEKDSL